MVQSIALARAPLPLFENIQFLLVVSFHNRKDWLFCWTEIGAERVGIIQSLLVTCKLHGIDPCTYLVDVLQRISIHPARRAIELTSREWNTKFTHNPMKSDLALTTQ